VSLLLESGATMDEACCQAAFWTAVGLCESAPEEGPIPAAAPRLLHHVFDADHRQLLQRARLAHNVTCMQPESAGSGYEVINDELLAVPLRPGRACDGGVCCDECSRVLFSEFATAEEADTFVSELQHAIVPPLHQFSLQKCAFRDMRTTLVFVRLVERMRRAIAHEYGLPLRSVTPLQTFVSCFQGAQDKQGGLHTDESTFKEFHYSCVLYLSTQHDDFEGGTFFWSDPPTEEGGPRRHTPLAPSKGAAIIFSSGWENMHEVEPLASGTRFAVPSFFTTLAEPPDEPFADDEAIAAELRRTLLMPETVDDVRQFIMGWHGLLAPGR